MNENSPKNQDEKAVFPNPVTFLLEIPLYKEYELSNFSYEEVKKLESFSASFDAYCIDCKRQSVFWSQKLDELREPYELILMRGTYEQHITKTRSFYLMLTCSRDRHHLMVFYFKVYNGKLIKVGQFPSIADLQSNDIEKYRKVLSKERFKDFKRGIGLVSHGVGIGSFVYLRRIFEDLIIEAHQEAVKNPDWIKENEEAYNTNGVRIIEKILLLKDFLPEYLVQNRNIYGILSKGIHSLSEDECLEYYPVIKIGIELILDEKLEKINKAEKITNNQKEIQKILQKQTK
jgi:hypothetical protein